MRKNIRPFLDRPLLAWTIEAAGTSGIFGGIILSTDDEEIAHAAVAWGAWVPFRRPTDLALDTTPTTHVVRHALEWMRQEGHSLPEFVLVLEPTSPARRPFHIREAARLLVGYGADSVASISEVPHHYVPQKLIRLGPGGMISGTDGTPLRQMVHRRQGLPRYYALNGLIFGCRTSLVLNDPPTLWGNRVLGYMVSRQYCIDLDDPRDWPAAEEQMRRLLLEDGQ